MARDDRSIRKLQPDFVISPGPQVVVKVAKVLPGGKDYKPAGSVGLVVEAPPSNREPYLVRFADGAVVRAYFAEMALRRREVDDILGDVDVGEHRAELLEIRGGGLSFEEVKRRALELDQRFQEAFERTALPDQPDFDRVDRFPIAARRRMVDA